MEAAAATSNPALIGHFDSVSAQVGQVSPDGWVADTRTPGQSINVEYSIAIETKTQRGCVRWHDLRADVGLAYPAWGIITVSTRQTTSLPEHTACALGRWTPRAAPAGGSATRPNTCRSTTGPAATSTRWPRLDQGDPSQWVGRRPQHTDHTRWRRDIHRQRDHAVQVRPGHRNPTESGRCGGVPPNRSEPRIQRHDPGASWGPGGARLGEQHLSIALPLCSAAWASPSNLGRRTVPCVLWRSGQARPDRPTDR